MQRHPLLDHLYSSGKRSGCREIPDWSVFAATRYNTAAVEIMIPSNLAEISGEVFTFSADVGLFDAYFHDAGYDVNVLMNDSQNFTIDFNYED